MGSVTKQRAIELPFMGPYVALESLGKVRLARSPQATLEINVNALTHRLERHVCNAKGQNLRITHQQGRLRARDFEMNVYQRAQLAVRPGNVHDLLNLCMWCLWPLSKAALNALHVERGYLDTGGDRSAAGNAGTLLDECGLVIVSPESEPADTIERHDWQSLFIQHRNRWHNTFHPRVIGHGLLEQMLSPFDGIMGKCLVLSVPKGATPDQVLARKLDDLTHPGQLLSLPVLGVPGWHVANVDPTYYRNTNYFRPRHSLFEG